VPDLVPGNEYDPRDIRRSLGASGTEGAIVVGSERIALFAKVGNASDGPSFPERAMLRWPGEVPRRAVESKVLVFVDRGEGTVRFLGEGCVVEYSSGKGLPRDVRFTIQPSLTRADWLGLLGGNLPRSGPPPEALLADIGAGSTPKERWDTLVGFVERWHGKPLGVPIETSATIGPSLLRKLLGVQSVVPEIVQQNELVRPDELALEDGKVVFLVENQGVCRWATEPEGEDPRVWYQNSGEDTWLEEPERLSSFLIQMVLFEAILNTRFGAFAIALPADTVQSVLSRVTPLAGGRWNWLGARFFARDGALVMTMENDGACDVWLAASRPLALSRFEDLVTEEWERIAF
jgi:hypothetical protein